MLIAKVSEKGKIIDVAKLDDSGLYAYEIEGIKIVGDQLYIMESKTEKKGDGRGFSIVSISKNEL